MSKEKIYKQALENIIKPITYLEKEAEKSGEKLNGYAYQLIQLPTFYQEIAIRALREAEREAEG